MSNTSNNKTANSKPTKSKDKDKLRVIVGEIGRDSKTGILGRGYSSDNGKTFHVTDTMYGRLYDPNDIEGIWNGGTADKVKKEVDSATAEIPAAVSAANSAVSAAESAVAASKVNSDAIVAQSEAISEAKSAMDSATAGIQQTAANAAKIRADVARVQNEVDTAKTANSASVDKLKSDIGLAQKDLDNVHDSLAKAQSAVEQNQKLINDSVAKINSDIAQSRQDIVTAQQANNDLAKQLDTYSKEAQEQGKTIKTIQDNQDGFSITIADVKGDVTKVSDTVDGLSAGLKDAQGNIASVKAQADQLNATLTDHSKDIAQLTATAKELSSTLEDADGRLSKVEQTASEQSTTLSDLQGNLTQVKQTADNLVTTLKDAQGNIDQIKQDAKGTLEQLSNVQGDITALQTDVSGIKLTIADHEKNIHTLQVDSKTLKDDMADAKGNISSLQKTSTSLVSEFKDHDGRLSKIEQTATEHTSELADTKGNLDKVTQKANALQLLLSDAQKNIQKIQLDAKGLHDTLTGQGNQLASLNVTLNNLDSKYSGITGDLQSKQTALSTEQQQTKDMLLRKADKSEVDNVKGTVTQVSAEQKVMADQISSKVSSEDFSALDNKVGGAIAQIQKNSTAIDQTNQKIGLKADQTEVDKIKNMATQNSSRLDVMANEISSKVTSTDVNNIVDKRGYATTSTVQSLITQKADTISETITSLDKKVGDNADATDKKIQEITASIDGVQSTVKNKADQSAVTQLANTYQIKLTGNLLASLGKKAQKYTVGNNTFFPFASIDVTKVTKGTVLTLSFDYSSDADCAFAPQLDGTPWVPWGDIKDNPISVKANVPGHYVKQITVGDDSWTKGTAKNIAIRIDNFGGTFTVSNLTLRSGDNVASTFDMLQYDMDLRVQKGELLSQINLTAGNTLIQSNKLYLDASSVVITGTAFIPSAAIASLSADKVNTGWLNTNNVNLGDGRTRIIADHDYMYIQPTGSASSNTGIRMGYSGLDFLTNVIPNGYSSSVPYYSVGYDGAANGYFKISAFDHINPGGATATQNWFTMYDAISLNNKEVNIAANNKPRIRVTDNGIEVRPTIFFNNENYSGTWAGFTRLDNKDVVEFNTGNNDGENFRVNSGARFMKYVYFNDYCRAQGWLTYSTLSKKTNIKKLDTSLALDKIRQDDQYLYEYKRNVAKGVYDPQASFIIDDVNDVSHYSVPREFIDQTGKYREPSVELSYLIAAFQEIDKQVQKQKEEIKELKEKLQHE